MMPEKEICNADNMTPDEMREELKRMILLLSEEECEQLLEEWNARHSSML